jgi:hypothetical protein
MELAITKLAESVLDDFELSKAMSVVTPMLLTPLQRKKE